MRTVRFPDADELSPEQLQGMFDTLLSTMVHDSTWAEVEFDAETLAFSSTSVWRLFV